MKKILLGLLLIPLTTIVIGLAKYNIELKNFITQEPINSSKSKNKSKLIKTEVYIVGTVHFETDAINRDHFYNYLESISPSVILYEGDSSSVKKMLKKRDYISQLSEVFKKQRRMEKAIVYKYIDGYPNCIVLPYEWELRDKYHRKYRLKKKSKKLINSVIRLYRDNLLTKDQSEIITKFLALNNKLIKIGNGTIADINNLTTDSILRQRQYYIYKEIPEIAKNRKELAKYSDFIPLHMNYWDIRNRAMAQNILKQIKRNPNKVIVVLNGFYHRYYLIDELKKYELEYEFSIK